MISDLLSLTGVHCQNSDRINKTEYSQSDNEASIFKSIHDENKRCGGWVRLFPTSDTWEFYSQYLEVRTTSYNLILHQKLFPKRWLSGCNKISNISRAK
jgi:hypothetical protein